MRLMGLETVYRRPRTSVAEPDHRVYPYLLHGLTIERPNQVWCSDITCIPVLAGCRTGSVALAPEGPAGHHCSDAISRMRMLRKRTGSPWSWIAMCPRGTRP